MPEPETSASNEISKEVSRMLKYLKEPEPPRATAPLPKETHPQPALNIYIPHNPPSQTKSNRFQDWLSKNQLTLSRLTPPEHPLTPRPPTKISNPLEYPRPQSNKFSAQWPTFPQQKWPPSTQYNALKPPSMPVKQQAKWQPPTSWSQAKPEWPLQAAMFGKQSQPKWTPPVKSVRKPYQKKDENSVFSKIPVILHKFAKDWFSKEDE